MVLDSIADCENAENLLRIINGLEELLFLLKSSLEKRTVSTKNTKKQARAKVCDILHCLWQEFENRNQIPSTYEKLIIPTYVVLSSESEGLKEKVSDTMILKEVRKLAKLKNWNPVRGKNDN